MAMQTQICGMPCTPAALPLLWLHDEAGANMRGELWRAAYGFQLIQISCWRGLICEVLAICQAVACPCLALFSSIPCCAAADAAAAKHTARILPGS